MEGILAWNNDKLMLRHIVKGEYSFDPIAVGQFLDVFQNGYWRRTQVQSVQEEPFFENWNYGNGIGCEARTVEE